MAAIVRSFGNGTARLELTGAEALVVPISAVDVAEAIGHLKAEKACVRDRLVNELYRDHASSYFPHLTDLFSAVIKHGRAPRPS